MSRLLLPLALLPLLAQRTDSFQVPEFLEIGLVGVALFGVSALLRAPRRARRQDTPALVLAHSPRRLHGGRSPGAGRAAA